MFWQQRCSSAVVVLLATILSAAQSNDPTAARPRGRAFPFVSLERAKPELDSFAASLQAAPESMGYYAVSIGSEACEGEEEFIAALIREYLVKERGISESRLVYVKGGVFWQRYVGIGLIPPGAKVPQAAAIDGYPLTHLRYNSRVCRRLRRQWRRGAAPNNGMHPTADTPPLMLLQRCGAAGDAWRYAALLALALKRQIDSFLAKA